MARKLILPPKRLAPARPDGRPLYFDLAEGAQVPCHLCLNTFGVTTLYSRGTAYMNDPANSPVRNAEGLPDESVYLICRGHTPENAVIYDPLKDECHNKSGTEVWREDRFLPGPNGT